MKFRHKPVVIEAFQWMGHVNKVFEGFPEWFMVKTECGEIWVEGLANLKITTLEGIMTASLGDWIIHGVKGEVYPCKPDIFEITYESEGNKT